MSQILENFQTFLLFRNQCFLVCRKNSLASPKHKLRRTCRKIKKFQRLQFSSPVKSQLTALDKAEACYESELRLFPHVQTLGQFPKEELFGKVVMVRFDSTILPVDKKKLDPHSASTVKYLCEARAKVILVGSWSSTINSKPLALEAVAEYLSSVLQLKVIPTKLGSSEMMAWIEKRTELDILLLENISQLKDDVSNCQKFAQQLSFGVDIFVNDSFSEVHKILASTVGIACFCSACIAGFHFQLGLSQLEKIIRTDKKPYVAIIGGGNLIDKAAALHFLASICDALVFVGEMAFQIMHAFGLPVPIKLVERKALKQAHAIVEAAKARNIEIVLPKDFWCISYSNPHQMEISSASSILDGWKPVDLGPSTLEEISSFLSKCKKIIWIGPVKFSSSNLNAGGASKLAAMVDALSQRNCDVSIVGKMACDAFHGNSSSATAENMIQNASVVWEFLKGRNLPGLLALDRAYPFEMDWKCIYNDPDRPLVVDIGSGNGLFLFGMARRKDFNFLGLEINRKLVKRCLDHVSQSVMKNVHFVATNATSTFRSIISSYPGRLVLVSIQCPNPDFNKPGHRWRMLQKSLVEAIADLLASGGKVFLQSDIEEVAIRMKEEFSKYGKGKLEVENLDKAAIHQGGWLKENPFGIRSDWEQHVLDRGDPMYRLCLSKSESSEPHPRGYHSHEPHFQWVGYQSFSKFEAIPDQREEKLVSFRKMVENNQKHHAIVLPMPYQGHINPAIHLSINLASRGFTVTFVNTELIDSLIIKARRGTTTAPTDDIFTQARNSGLDIRYTTISDGFPLGFDRTTDAYGFMMGMMYVFSAHVDELVKKLAGLEPPPTCLIADSFYAWPSIIASKYNLVNVSFFTEPALVFAIDSHLDLLKENGHFGCKDCRKDSIDYIPGVEAIEPRDLPLYLQQENNTTSAVYLTVYKGFEDAKKADIVICNTVQELEPQTISALEEKQPFYAIGPLFPQSFTEQTAFRSLLPESDCCKWLDSKPPGSVLYASFGSLAHLTKEHIMELGRGLMLSEVNFIWVLRPGMAITDEMDFSMDGFQECVRDRGLIVPWCHQPAVISHPAVGGFITHCGWNSILESIWCSVPMICYPLIVDQPTNRKLVVDEWKIGINLCNDDDKSISKEEVASKVKFLMKAESSIELRKAIKDVRKNLENALGSNGSSVKNVDKFVEKIKAKFNQSSVRNNRN